MFNDSSETKSKAKYKSIYGEGFKILTRKQMIVLPKALLQVEVGNASENLLNKIRQITYSLYRAREIMKKVYNIMNSIKLGNRIDTIFMNSRNSKIYDPHRLSLNLSDEIKLKRKDK